MATGKWRWPLEGASLARGGRSEVRLCPVGARSAARRWHRLRSMQQHMTNALLSTLAVAGGLLGCDVAPSTPAPERTYEAPLGKADGAGSAVVDQVNDDITVLRAFTDIPIGVGTNEELSIDTCEPIDESSVDCTQPFEARFGAARAPSDRRPHRLGVSLRPAARAHGRQAGGDRRRRRHRLLLRRVPYRGPALRAEQRPARPSRTSSSPGDSPRGSTSSSGWPTAFSEPPPARPPRPTRSSRSWPSRTRAAPCTGTGTRPTTT